ncbi:MAG TPA: FCD domain-containing protein [Candidatus Limnocylindria bacterium]|nr:FCD domain-containing protein [Candidatus Limnocylindria bacterium]
MKPLREASVADTPAANLLAAGRTDALEPMQLRTAAEQIADRLTAAIALGEFIPGQRLPAERDLAAMVGVSRATIREALGRLSSAGYVTVKRGRHGGAFVESGWGATSAEVVRRTLAENWEHYEQLLDFRQLMEPLIAGLAAARRDEDDLLAIQAALEAYRAAADREASRAADEALHVAVARATHNSYLVSVSSQVRMEVSLGFSAEPYSEAIRARAVEDHGELVAAVVKGDAEAASAISRRHFMLTASALEDAVRRARRETDGSTAR